MQIKHWHTTEAQKMIALIITNKIFIKWTIENAFQDLIVPETENGGRTEGTIYLILMIHLFPSLLILH